MKNLTSKILLLLMFGSLVASAQNGTIHFIEHNNYKRPDARKELKFPDILGYKTLKCDFHIHTDYTDGMVAPEERVREAWREGLDAIAITDHNWLPKYYKNDLNESYDRAAVEANKKGLTVIKGVEYTSSKPVGHLNFLFVKDANPYHFEKIAAKEAVEKASAEGAFIIYNHPGWPDHNSDLFDFQKDFLKQKKIHAMEVFNAGEFYPIVIDYCKQYGIAPLGCSDIHAPIHQIYYLDIAPRTMTLVFAKDASQESIREALFANRTVAYANGILAGGQKYIEELILNSLHTSDYTEKGDNVEFFVYNDSDLTYTMLHPDCFKLTFPAHQKVKVRLAKKHLPSEFAVTNCFTASETNCKMTFQRLICVE